MERAKFKERMKALKAYKDKTGKGYWDWKVLAFDGGGEIIGPPTEKEMLSESKIKKLTEYEDEDFDLNDRISVMNDIIVSKIQKKVNDNTAMTMASYNNVSDKFSTPFVKNKKLKLTNAEHLTGAVLSENLLDSLHKYANIVGIPLEEAVGLAAQETTFGKYEGYMRGQNDMLYYDVEKMGSYGAPEEILNDHSYSNDFLYDVPYEVYAAFLRKYPEESYDQLRLRTAKELETNPNYYINKGVKKYLSVLNPWVHALELYKSGKYNTGDKSHTQDVKRAGNLVLQDPALREWKSKNSIPAYTDGTDGDDEKTVTYYSNKELGMPFPARIHDDQGGHKTSSDFRWDVFDKYDPAAGVVMAGIGSWLGLHNDGEKEGEEDQYYKAYLGLPNAVPPMKKGAQTNWDAQIEAQKEANGELLSDFYGTTPRMDSNIQALSDTLMLGKISRDYDLYKKEYGKTLPSKSKIEKAYEFAKKILNNPNQWHQADYDELRIKNNPEMSETLEGNPLGMLAKAGVLWDDKNGFIYVHDTYDFNKTLLGLSDVPVRPREMKIRSRIKFDPKKGSKLLRDGKKGYVEDYPEIIK